MPKIHPKWLAASDMARPTAMAPRNTDDTVCPRKKVVRDATVIDGTTVHGVDIVSEE